jgi:hypothetical protein
MAFKRVTKTSRSFSGKCFYNKETRKLIDSKDGEEQDIIELFELLGGDGQEIKVSVSQEDTVDDIEDTEE